MCVCVKKRGGRKGQREREMGGGIEEERERENINKKHFCKILYNISHIMCSKSSCLVKSKLHIDFWWTLYLFITFCVKTNTIIFPKEK